MYLKRIFPKGVEVRVEKDGERVEVFEECLIEIKRASPVWHVSQKLMDKGIGEGWMSVGKRQVTLHTPSGDVVYDIHSAPDRKSNRHYFDCRLAAVEAA